MGCWLSSRGDDAGALAEYDEAIRIFPAYPEALNNRGGTLIFLGRVDDAKESYRAAVHFDPGHAGAAASLMALEKGILFTPQRPKL